MVLEGVRMPPARFSRRRSESRIHADRAGEGRSARPTGRCDQPPARAESGLSGCGCSRGLLASLLSLARQRRGCQMKTTREKSEEKRQAKLEEIREQVDSGTLVIRPMTPEERRQYPPRPVERKRFDRT